MPSARHPGADLVITFRATTRASVSKQQTRQASEKAERQYKRLIQTLTSAGLKAVGRGGESLGHLLVFVKCPPKRVEQLAERECDHRHPLSSADKIRLVHTFLTSTPNDGGLGVSPDSPEWDLVQSIFALKDQKSNEVWTHVWRWGPIKIPSVQPENIRKEFGDSLVLYFAFRSAYIRFLVFPATLGFAANFFFPPYSPTYSILLCVWSITFVEWWRVYEQSFILRSGTRHSLQVEKQRAQYNPGMGWWVREPRALASIAVVLTFASFVSVFLAGIFMLEAFVAELYQGLKKQAITASLALLQAALTSSVLPIYQTIAVGLTDWENHPRNSDFTASLALRTFSIDAIVAYLGISLSAFVYMPFGDGIMNWVRARVVLNDGKDAMNSSIKLNPSRLSAQMFTYMVTVQVSNKFTEVGLPFVLKYINFYRTRQAKAVVEDDGDEMAFLNSVREQAALPEYDVCIDYSRAVIQFGYVALWSAIWPLAGVMALLYNLVGVWSGTFKMRVHYRRPLPSQTHKTGPWVDVLAFLAWLGAWTNFSLVHLFSPQPSYVSTSLLSWTAGSLTKAGWGIDNTAPSPTFSEAMEFLVVIILLCPLALFVFLMLQSLIRDVVHKVCWRGRDEVEEREREEADVGGMFVVGSVNNLDGSDTVLEDEGEDELDTMGFWERDDGVEDIQRILKEA